MKSILVINGPNLNLLGTREPEIYGSDTLDDVQKRLEELAFEFDLSVDFFQSNSEGGIIDRLHKEIGRARAVIVNAGAFTHTSVALRDALVAMDAPIFEVHISNVHRREEFRHHSYISGIAESVIVGCGVRGYEYAFREAAHRLTAS